MARTLTDRLMKLRDIRDTKKSRWETLHRHRRNTEHAYRELVAATTEMLAIETKLDRRKMQ